MIRFHPPVGYYHVLFQNLNLFISLSIQSSTNPNLISQPSNLFRVSTTQNNRWCVAFWQPEFVLAKEYFDKSQWLRLTHMNMLAPCAHLLIRGIEILEYACMHVHWWLLLMCMKYCLCRKFLSLILGRQCQLHSFRRTWSCKKTWIP